MHNINWRQWGDEAFAGSRRSGRPVLLSISAVWCHWCHVMDQTTYANDRVAQIINERFVPVRVDSDRNPDINSRYNMGGWPTTVFLTHERDVITGATYLPPDRMASLLMRLESLYREEHDDLVARARSNRVEMQAQAGGSAPGLVEQRHVENVLRTVRSAYDPRHGGFGTDQKFPHASALELLLVSYELGGSGEDLEMVVKTLEAMTAGAIFDPVEGGMFRYATERDWTAPHYEKMLEDNADIAGALLDAHRITSREDFLLTAQRVFGYLESTLMDPERGILFGSQDADEGYYQKGAQARAKLARPKVDTAAYTDSNAAAVRAYLKLYGVSGDVSARERALRTAAFLDDLPRADDGTVCHFYEDGRAQEFGNLVDQAALIHANALCFEASGLQGYLSAARCLADSLAAFESEGGGLYDVSATRAEHRGLIRYLLPLPENSRAALALLKLADVADESSYRDRARQILEAAVGQYQYYGLMAADYAIAVALLETERVVVTIAAEPRMADRFVQAALGACGANCSVRTKAPERPEEQGATVCAAGSCLGWVTDPELLGDQIRKASDVTRAAR